MGAALYRHQHEQWREIFIVIFIGVLGNSYEPSIMIYIKDSRIALQLKLMYVYSAQIRARQ